MDRLTRRRRKLIATYPWILLRLSKDPTGKFLWAFTGAGVEVTLCIRKFLVFGLNR